MSLGAGPDALKWLREVSGLTQRALAERSGISERTIRGLERGHVRTPHQASLRALAGAAGLDEVQRATFLRAWAPDRVSSLSEMGIGETSFTDILAETILQTEVEEHLVASWSRFRAREGRVYTAESDLVIEARRDGVETYSVPYIHETSDEPRLEPTMSGCRLRHTHYFQDHRLTVFELQLDRPLSVGESCSFTFGVEMSGFLPADPADDTDWMLRLQHRMVPLTVVEILFEPPAPPTVWEVEQVLRGPRRRVRTVTPDERGRVHLVKRYARPGAYGFEWPRGRQGGT